MVLKNSSHEEYNFMDNESYQKYFKNMIKGKVHRVPENVDEFLELFTDIDEFDNAIGDWEHYIERTYAYNVRILDLQYFLDKIMNKKQEKELKKKANYEFIVNSQFDLWDRAIMELLHCMDDKELKELKIDLKEYCTPEQYNRLTIIEFIE